MTISVGPATESDAESLADLIDELEAFYDVPTVEGRQERVAQIRMLVFGAIPAGHVLLAREDDASDATSEHGIDRVVGMAAYSYLWPAVGTTRSVFLKELFVPARARRRGVGRLLMTSLQEIAAQHGCSRVDWTTDRENVEAQAFYAAMGFEIAEQKIYYRKRLDAA
jgi:ribosomal protein S18 acetylase RimI-like enzyme